jgi:hypothetical protein
MRLSFAVFLVATTIGILCSTLIYRDLQTDDSGALVLQNRARIELSDADKKLIEVRDSTSKWLLGLAVGLLPGLVVKKSSTDEPTVQDKVLPLLAGALLLVSLYGFFLAQDSVAFVLSRGPQYHLYGWLSTFPILLQFWSLLAALVVLMAHWIRPSEKVSFPTLAVLLAFAANPHEAQAASVTPSSTKPCVQAWAASREVDLSDQEVGLASSVVARIAHRADVSPSSVCDFASVHLDQLRFEASKTAASLTPLSVADALREADKDLRSTAISPGTLLERVLSVSELWHKPSGLMRIEGKPGGATVLLNSRVVGLTNLDLRLVPGKYLVEVLSGGAVVMRKADVVIEDGKLWAASF